MKKRIRHRIETLREQPEHIRMRTASIFTVVGGVIVVALWLGILLPLQLRFNGSPSESAQSQPQAVSENLINSGTPVPQVGGIQDIRKSASPTPQIFISPSPSPEETVSPTVSPLP